MRVHYLEAYCRANSHTTDWSKHTVVGHTTEQVSATRDGTRIELLFMLGDGVPVRHVIPSTCDEVDFFLGGFKPGAPSMLKARFISWEMIWTSFLNVIGGTSLSIKNST